MGMSTHIKAFIPDTDETYKKHSKVLIACNEADIELPKATADYFGSEYADLELLDSKLEVDLKLGKHYTEYNAEMTEGFEVELADLPKGVTKIRFTNSW